jgi:hypothetical protein
MGSVSGKPSFIDYSQRHLTNKFHSGKEKEKSIAGFGKECDEKEYFWWDELHALPPIHKAVAAQVVSQLKSEPVID